MVVVVGDERTGARHDRVSPINVTTPALTAWDSARAMPSTSEVNTQNPSACDLNFVNVAATCTDRLVQSQETSEVRVVDSLEACWYHRVWFFFPSSCYRYSTLPILRHVDQPAPPLLVNGLQLPSIDRQHI